MADRSIIAIGGGKGGVGKSVIAAGIAVLLALMDKRVVLVDMDFGSSNLHICLGEKSPASSIKDFLLNKKSTLSEVLLDTQVEHLKFISGAGDMPGLANMKYSQKLKIIRHLKALDGDYVILDLAPGITFNVLDFFSVADKAVLVTTPEATSITNTFSFIKAVVFRELSKAFKGNSEITSLLDLAKDPRNVRGICTLAELGAIIEEIDSKRALKFKSILESFKPQLILNMVRHEDEMAMGHMLISLVEQYLSVKCEYLGYMPYDNSLPDSIAKARPFMLECLNSDTAVSLWVIVSKIAGRLPEYDLPALIEEHTRLAQSKIPPFPPLRPEADQLLAGAEKVSRGSTCAGEGIPVDKEPAKRWETHVSSEKPKTRLPSGRRV